MLFRSVRCPVRVIVLSFQECCRGADQLEELAVELLLNSADRDVASVGATVTAVEWSPSPDPILSGLQRDRSRWDKSCKERHERSHAIDDCRIDDLPFTRSEEHTSELHTLIRTSYAVFSFKQTTTQK